MTPSCWTALNESDAPTELVFLVNGAQIVFEIKPLRWLLFMGLVPHGSRNADNANPAKTGRVHHSSFNKPRVIALPPEPSPYPYPCPNPGPNPIPNTAPTVARPSTWRSTCSVTCRVRPTEVCGA